MIEVELGIAVAVVGIILIEGMWLAFLTYMMYRRAKRGDAKSLEGFLKGEPGDRKALYAEFQRLQLKIEELERTQTRYLRNIAQLEELYSVLGRELLSGSTVDRSVGEKRVKAELSRTSIRRLRLYRWPYELLVEAEASIAMGLADSLPRSGKKALLLVYFNALEIYLRRLLEERVPAGVTILLGDDGHINTRKKDWHFRWNLLSLGKLIRVATDNDYLFVGNHDRWQRVQRDLRLARDIRNVVAHPSKELPDEASVRDLVYRLIDRLPSALKKAAVRGS